MVTMILQITIHSIWLSRNAFVKEHRYTPLNLVLARIRLDFGKCVRKKFSELPLVEFKRQFCHTPSICRVERDTQLVLNLFPVSPAGLYLTDFT